MLIRGWLLPCWYGLAVAVCFLGVTQTSAQQPGEDAAREALEAAGLADRFENNLPQPNQDLAFQDVAPPLAYRVAQQAFFRGEITRAIAILNQLERDAASTSTMRHLLGRISIRTLLGECHLQAGDLAAAAEHYDTAIQVIVANPTFLSGIQWRVLTSPPSDIPRRRSVGTSRQIEDDFNRLMEAPNELVRTNLDLWPSAERVPLVRLRRYLMAGVPAGNWFISEDLPENIDQLRGLDIAEVLRQLSLAAYRMRWLRGRAFVLQNPVGQQLLAATVPPGVLGSDQRFHAAGTLVAASRVAVRYHAGDDSDIQLVEPLDQISGGFHVLTPIARLTRLRSLSNRWMTHRQIANQEMRLREGLPAVVLPSRQDLVEFVETAVSTSEVSFALGQFQLAVECFELALDELDRWEDIESLALALERDLVTRSEILRRQTPAIAYQLRVFAARAALLANRPAAAGNHLSMSERFRRARRLDLPHSAAVANWLQLQVDVQRTVGLARLDPEGDDAKNLQTLKELQRRRIVREELLEQTRRFASGMQTSDPSAEVRSITHPLAFRFWELQLPNQNRVPAATRSQRYQSHWRESLAGQDLTAFDQFCFELDRQSWTGLGVRLAVAAGEAERVAVRMDEQQSASARNTLGELPGTTDLRCALRQVLRNKELSLEDFFPNQADLNKELQALAPAMQLNPRVLGLDAAILHERLQGQLSSLASNQALLPRVEPPPIPERNERPDWSVLPANMAIVSFQVDDDNVVGTLVHRNQASHWQVRSATELRQQCERWLATILSLPTTVDEIENKAQRLRTQQMELELTQRLFPPLCGIDHPGIQHVIVVPSGFLWQLPFEELVIRHDANDQTQRWRDRGTVAYAHTLGTAMSVATSPSQDFVPEDSDPVARWDASQSGVSPSLNDPPSETVSAGPIATWGDSVWWGSISQNSLVPPEASVPLASQGERATSRGVHAWDQRLGQVGQVGLHGWVDLSSKYPPFEKVSQILRPEIQNHLFVQASRLHAAGLEDLVMPRLPAMQEASDLLVEELSMELGQVRFREAWERSLEILRVSEFTFPEGVNLVPLTNAAGGMAGNHPRVQLPYIHLPFSGL
ncbi:putative signal peptide protein [Rhodopirellula islandica]|uniref:Signal peptide protein n=1 Tax=Rhodopirellula islandica TaxID=595434 RepID=A0A0J1EL14_RHOIS|nr:hypothetical protein [Rhodopirellula islandica]KLU06239.1 putative signal peptide protein [Rhodopirellula islandica]